METAVLPFTAYEQAIFVALFIVLVTVLIRWFSTQQEKWQKFMTGMNLSWQNFIESQRKEERETLDKLKKSVGDLTVVTSTLVQEVREIRSDLRDHDHTVETRIQSVVNASVPVKSRPRNAEPKQME
jgi:preprotein translocase subunit SecF